MDFTQFGKIDTSVQALHSSHEYLLVNNLTIVGANQLILLCRYVFNLLAWRTFSAPQHATPHHISARSRATAHGAHREPRSPRAGKPHLAGRLIRLPVIPEPLAGRVGHHVNELRCPVFFIHECRLLPKIGDNILDQVPGPFNVHQTSRDAPPPTRTERGRAREHTSGGSHGTRMRICY